MALSKETLNGKEDVSRLAVQDPGIKSEKSDDIKTIANKDVPSIRLSPEQIEEIHADEYSLMLFYATRVEPLSLAEIKKQIPEPEPKKALSVMERFVNIGLVHITQEGKYYSNFPQNYINYSDYRYDNDLEAKKDNKVFRLMKEFTGNREYWKNKSYFYMDAFYTEEKTKEIQEIFHQIRLKAKDFANQNAKKKSIRGLFFRRLKFYDMLFSTLLVTLFLFGISQPATAKEGGNDPRAKLTYYSDWIGYEFQTALLSEGGGNDPGGKAFLSLDIQKEKNYKLNLTNKYSANLNRNSQAKGIDGGGGHDPGTKPARCVISYQGRRVIVYSAILCRAQSLFMDLIMCEKKGESCLNVEQELVESLTRHRVE